MRRRRSNLSPSLYRPLIHSIFIGQRWFVVHSGPEAITEAVLARELDFTTRNILSVKKNESSWNYLRGLARFHPELTASVTTFCEEAVKGSEEKNFLALGLLADLR